MKVTRAVQTLLTCLLHSEKCQEFTMYPALNILHSAPIQSCHKTHFKLCPRPLHRRLLFSSSDDSDTSEDVSPTARTTPAGTQVCLEEDEEEHFQTVPLDDEHWTTEEVPDRTLCIHEYALPHWLWPYPCPYASYLLPSYAGNLYLSDISNFEDIMIMSSEEDVPALLDMTYWKRTWFDLKHYITINLLIN